MPMSDSEDPKVYLVFDEVAFTCDIAATEEVAQDLARRYRNGYYECYRLRPGSKVFSEDPWRSR